MNTAPRLPVENEGSHVTRLLSPGVEAALEQFASPEVLTAGKVNLISMDAVAERFGARWPMRRDQVHEHVEGVLDRSLGTRGFHLRISETDILVCHPELGRLAGQALCLRLLRDILSHFLGAADQAEIGVHEVLRVSPEGVEARLVDPRAAEAAEDNDEANSGQAVMTNSVLGPVSVWTPFIAGNGRKIEVHCTLDPVIELRGRSVIGLRFRRRVTDAATGWEFTPQEIERLSRTDRLRIDLGVIALGLKQLRSRDRSELAPALIIPVSFSSLSNLDDRARIVSAFQEVRSYARQGLICALRDIEGVPLTTLQTAVSVIAPHALFVIGHLNELNRSEVRFLKDAGLRGISTECPPNLEDAAFLGWVKQVLPAAKLAARSVLLYRVATMRQAMIAAALGATHAEVTGDTA